MKMRMIVEDPEVAVVVVQYDDRQDVVNHYRQPTKSILVWKLHHKPWDLQPTKSILVLETPS